MPNGVGEEGVEAHAGGLRKGDVGHQTGKCGADGGRDAGGQQDGVVIHTCLAQQAGVDEDDVGHGKERGNAAYDLCPVAAAAFRDLEELIHIFSSFYSVAGAEYAPV